MEPGPPCAKRVLNPFNYHPSKRLCHFLQTTALCFYLPPVVGEHGDTFQLSSEVLRPRVMDVTSQTTDQNSCSRTQFSCQEVGKEGLTVCQKGVASAASVHSLHLNKQGGRGMKS